MGNLNWGYKHPWFHYGTQAKIQVMTALSSGYMSKRCTLTWASKKLCMNRLLQSGSTGTKPGMIVPLLAFAISKEQPPKFSVVALCPLKRVTKTFC